MIPSRAMGLRLAAIAAVCLSARVAIAGPPLVGVAVDGAPSAAYADALTASAAKAAGDPTQPVATCVTATCVDQVLTARGGERGLVIAVTISGDFHDRFAIAVSMVDRQGRVLRRRAEDCGTCAIGEASTAVGRLVLDTLGADGDDPVDVAVSAPRPVELTIDGAPAGPTPWVGKLPAGPHTFVAAGETREVFVEATGAPLRIDLGAARGGGGGRRWRRPGLVPMAVAGAGVALIATGAYLISIDGEPTCPTPTCPEVRTSASAGWTTVALGVVGLGAAGYLYWREQRPQRPAVIVVPTGDGAAAVAIGRW